MEIRPFLKHSLHPRCALRWLEAVPGYSEAARLGQDRQGIRMNKVSNDSAMMCVCVFVFLQSEDVRSEGHNLAWEGDICRKHR